MRIGISRMCASRNAGALCVLLIVSGSWGCGPQGGDVNETLAGTEELLARTEALVQAADTASDASDRVVLLERARTLLYRIMGAEEVSDAGTALADGKAVGALSLRRIEVALRNARMDLARTNPEYGRLIENALVAAAAAHPSEQDRAYETVALAQARLGDISGALATARNISDQAKWRAARYASLTWSDPPVVPAWNATALALAEQGEVEAALATLPPSQYEGPFLRLMAAKRAEAGDIRGALAIAARLGAGGDPRDIDPRDLDFDGLVVQVALAAARADAGDVETARESLADITGVLESDELSYRYILDGIADYARATLWQGIGSAWARAGDPAAARPAFEAAVQTASRLGMTLPFPLGFEQALGREHWPDTDPSGTFGSENPFHLAMADALGDYEWPAWADYQMSARHRPYLTYVRGFTLRRIACAARAAGVPIPVETLHEAAMAEVNDAWPDQTGYGAESWTVRAVAVALVERPCPD